MKSREYFGKVAREWKPELFHERILPPDEEEVVLASGQHKRIDFQQHYTGYLSFHITTRGKHYDSPCVLKLRFLEHADEIEESLANYEGWISEAWIQEEILHIYEFPKTVTISNRYAFHYLEITNMACSDKYQVVIDSVEVDAVSSAKAEEEIPDLNGSEEENTIDRIATRTLHECMQEVFEDGPKRDRRLWAGDLRLEALANYATYQNNALVKRCLYLLASVTDEKGWIPSNLFCCPRIEGDHQVLLDYAVLYSAMVRDYLTYTKDNATATDLLPVAEKQLFLCASLLDERGIIRDSSRIDWCFLDWNLKLNKQAGSQGVYLYSLKALMDLYEKLGVPEKIPAVRKQWEEGREAAVKYLFDEKRGLFFSGEEHQYSEISQAWLVLGGVFDSKTNRDILMHREKEMLKMVTPYARHTRIEALVNSGMKQEAYREMMSYWGKMAEEGCDTFYELFDPQNSKESPYGSFLVNSYCHAWSCTPSYWLRLEGLKKGSLQND